VGNAESLHHLMEQPTVKEDADELEESVENALKVAAVEGKEAIIDYVLANHSALAKGPCPAALVRATM
jgi:hypothetical protein